MRLEGMVTEAEGTRLEVLASKAPDGLAIVEVGSYKGKSTVHLARGAAGRLVTAVDMWDPTAHRRSSPFAQSDIRAAFDRQIAEAGVADWVRPVRGRSTEVAASWSEAIGLLFIDAAHDYENARADFEAWSAFVPSGGVIAFHDYGNPRWERGVTRVVNETIAGWPDFTVVGWLASGRKP